MHQNLAGGILLHGPPALLPDDACTPCSPGHPCRSPLLVSSSSTPKKTHTTLSCIFTCVCREGQASGGELNVLLMCCTQGLGFVVLAIHSVAPATSAAVLHLAESQFRQLITDGARQQCENCSTFVSTMHTVCAMPRYVLARETMRVELIESGL